MPLYEYVCSDCKEYFDTLVSNRDFADDVLCRSCSSDKVSRLVSSFATVGGYDDEFVPRQDSSAGGGCCGGSCGCGH
jgi:putative FmdB family regulatory protein